MSDADTAVNLERLDAAIGARDSEMPLRRSFARMRTEDPDPEPPPVVSERPTRRFPRATTQNK
jgi:hypothetical protein